MTLGRGQHALLHLRVTNGLANRQTGSRQGLKASVYYAASVTVSQKTLSSLYYKCPTCFPSVALRPDFKSDYEIHRIIFKCKI